MSEVVRYATPPSMARAYLRALLSRKRPGPDPKLPDLRSTLGPLVLDEEALAAYRDVCGTRAVVPSTYPQLLITPVHVAMLTDPSFPFPAMGLVHPRCRLSRTRPLAPGESVQMEAWFEGPREVRNGLEFDLLATATVDGEPVWESRAATFARTGKSGGPRPTEPEDTWSTRRPFAIPGDAGRRYARVSGDANPVHLHSVLARLFGYSRPIAHGWWLLARVLGELGEPDEGPLTLEVDLKRPVFMGEQLSLALREEGDATVFAVVDDREKVRLRGRLEPR